MGKKLSCDFYLGDHLPYAIKTFDYNTLPNYKGLLHNHFFHNFYWQGNAASLLFKNYDAYILIGEPYCLSHWIILLFSKFTKKQVYAWTHGWYGREGATKRLVKKAFFKLFDKLLVYSEYAIHLMKEEGFSSQSMVCIANSLDSDHILSIRQQLHKSNVLINHFKNDYPVLIYSGRIQKAKRLDLLIDAIDMLRKEGLNVNLVIIGKDDENTSLEQLTQTRGLQQQVWLYGPCYDNNILGELFYNSTICVSPGNVGLTAIHSLSFGCPVITHNDFPYQGPEFESIKQGITGDFFERGNALDLKEKIKQWLINNSGKRQEIREAAYKEVDGKWNIHYQINVLEKLLEKK